MAAGGRLHKDVDVAKIIGFSHLLPTWERPAKHKGGQIIVLIVSNTVLQVALA